MTRHDGCPPGCREWRSALTEVQEERRRQDIKWGEQDHPLTAWVAILTEEVGEFAQAVLKGQTKNARDEAIQCAAVAVAIVECIDRGAPTVEHRSESPTDYRTQLVKVLAWACHSEDCPASSSFPDESTCNCDIPREEESDVNSVVMMNEARASIGLEPQKVKRKCSECDGAGEVGGATYSQTCQNCDGNGSFDVVPNTA